jgi:uroporphyrinogen decarboxylase
MNKTGMNKLERVRAALTGESVDHVPVSSWGHDYTREWSAEGLATAMLERHFKYDWDWMKLNPRACYHSQIWGGVYRPSGDPYQEPVQVDYPIKRAADLDQLEVIGLQQAPLPEMLEAVTLIKKAIDAPFVQTVFSPLSVLRYLVGGDPDVVLNYIRTEAERLHHVLQVIADTLAAYSAECLTCGASGIFFATTQWASYDQLDATTYLEFGRPYDLKVLAAVQGAEFNVLHICRSHIMFDLLADYPVHAFNWESRFPGNPSIAEAFQRTNKALIGGVQEKTTMLSGQPEEVAAEVREAIAGTGGQRLLVGPGCSVSPATPESNLWALRRAVLD